MPPRKAALSLVVDAHPAHSTLAMQLLVSSLLKVCANAAAQRSQRTRTALPPIWDASGISHKMLAQRLLSLKRQQQHH